MIQIDLPPELEENLRRKLGDLASAAKEALLIEAYRRGKLSIGALAETLGVTVFEADQWLAERKVPLNYSIEDFRADGETLRKLRDSQ